MAAFDFPNSPSNGDTYSANGIDWIYNGSVWKKDATAGVKGQKGEIGVGDKGQKGQKGEVGATGDKGQKGEIGATGGTGGTGQKGQKGQDGNDATGTKGQKGEKGEIGAQGGTGGTGQKGEPGAGGSDGTKGQKGEAGAAASKGQKGEKGQIGADGGSGSDGSDGDKGQKGEAGSNIASVPSGGIIIWSGAANAIPSGWYLCDGNNSTPDLRNRFIIGSGAGSSYSVNATGGSKDAVIVQHNHSVTDPTHGHSVNDPGHQHNTSVTNSNLFPSFGGVTIGYGGPGQYPATTFTMSNATTGLVVNAGGTGISINNNGVSGTDKNLPPYYALCYIMKS